eukprot:TRINITY_DN49909_c0_g1_i1.p1 TRINITY_DN49909_c0_g1~~TRINITY_DN49909_c0_g1_i1.p1  ORF type:complete len:294 (-),score=52.76 TRINITY_DN49909_c0_g1_i1:205-1005(-)
MGANKTKPSRERVKDARTRRSREAEECEQLAKELFSKYDQDWSGTLSKDEIRRLATDLLGENTAVLGGLSDDDLQLIMSCGGSQHREELAKDELPKAIAVLTSIKKHNEALVTIFRDSDIDDSGQLAAGELKSLLTNIGGGVPPTQSDVRFILHSCQRSLDEPLPLTELKAALGCWYCLQRMPTVPELILDQFCEYDVDRSGTITHREFQALLLKLDPSYSKYTESDWKRLFFNINRNGTGAVDFREFVDWLMSGLDENDEDVEDA